MLINRKELLEQLESVLSGISTREIIEQSSCFVFQDNMVMTYNDEIACTRKACLPIKGAVIAMPLISILRKLKEDTLEITTDKEKLLIKGKRKKVGIRMDTEILLPIDTIGEEKPEKWKKLPGDFASALSSIQGCAGRDETRFALTCVHITPKWIEACDGYQAARYKIKIEIDKPTLVRKETIRYITNLDMSEFSETKNWIHFRNPSGLMLSCRRWTEDYPKLSKLLDIKGTPTKFPKGLIETVEKAQIFSAEGVETDRVEINLIPDKLRIRGEGSSGYYQEVKNIKYKGKSLSFNVSAGLFLDLLRRHNSCEIAEDKLKIATGNYEYITVLQSISKDKK